MAHEKLVTIQGLAELTGIPIRTLRSLQQRRLIPFMRLGFRTIKYAPSRVFAAIEKYEIRAVSDR